MFHNCKMKSVETQVPYQVCRKFALLGGDVHLTVGGGEIISGFFPAQKGGQGGRRLAGKNAIRHKELFDYQLFVPIGGADPAAADDLEPKA